MRPWVTGAPSVLDFQPTPRSRGRRELPRLHLHEVGEQAQARLGLQSDRVKGEVCRTVLYCRVGKVGG
jgi:hypothetical protein